MVTASLVVEDIPVVRLVRDIQRSWDTFLRRIILALPGEKTRALLTAAASSSSSADQAALNLYIAPVHTAATKTTSSSTALQVIHPNSFTPDFPFGHNNQDRRQCADHMAPQAGMVLEVYRDGRDADVSYELLEPMVRELGVTFQHAVDHAYMPVMTAGMDHAPFGGEVDGLTYSQQGWWQWWLRDLPWWHDQMGNNQDFSDYRMNSQPFAGGSHGEVWRGRLRCVRGGKKFEGNCGKTFVLKRLKVNSSVRMLEAGLREVYYGQMLAGQSEAYASMFTRYVDHFFRKLDNMLDLWIVFHDAGSTLRSFLYTGVSNGAFIIYQHSRLWTRLRQSVSGFKLVTLDIGSSIEEDDLGFSAGDRDLGKKLMRSVLWQVLEAAAFLHRNGIVHRDIKPSNILCETNIDMDDPRSLASNAVEATCILGDFSSAYCQFTGDHLYSGGPSRHEQTDEYAPPEAIFRSEYSSAKQILSPAFDSWSIGIVALELLLGTPNVFSVDQRTRVILSRKLQSKGVSDDLIEKAMYLAGLSQFCIFNKSEDVWPHRSGDPLHEAAMTKQTCTLHDFQRALRARDPLGWGFDNMASLLHLIWRLLAFDPRKRMTAAEALTHPYFSNSGISTFDTGDKTALESLMLDPRIDFNLSDAVDEFVCPKCNRVFGDWQSCHHHIVSRKHGKFCSYDKSSLPSCLHTHPMLPADPLSGYCDIQGRRRVIEDFHAIHLKQSEQFYAIFDGHAGNFASKFVASSLYSELSSRLLRRIGDHESDDWKQAVKDSVTDAFFEVHSKLRGALAQMSHGVMRRSGTTATLAFVTNEAIVIASLGDSRAVLSARLAGEELSAIQLTKDHVASDRIEQEAVKSRGGRIEKVGNTYRVNGTLAITRSLGDMGLETVLSQEPDVIVMTRDQIRQACRYEERSPIPCFLILASDGLWDMVSNKEAVEMVAQILAGSHRDWRSWRETTAFQQAAEALTLEAYVRGSTDNIGACVVAIE